jgi:hypothetical protein
MVIKNDQKAPMQGKEDLYADGSDSEGSSDAGGEDTASAEDQGDSAEAVIPKSVLAGHQCDVGDKIVLEVTGIHDNEVRVKYAPKEEAEENAEPASGEAEMPAGMGGGGGSDYE